MMISADEVRKLRENLAAAAQGVGYPEDLVPESRTFAFSSIPADDGTMPKLLAVSGTNIGLNPFGDPGGLVVMPNEPSSGNRYILIPGSSFFVGPFKKLWLSRPVKTPNSASYTYYLDVAKRDGQIRYGIPSQPQASLGVPNLAPIRGTVGQGVSVQKLAGNSTRNSVIIQNDDDQAAPGPYDLYVHGALGSDPATVSYTIHPGSSLTLPTTSAIFLSGQAAATKFSIMEIFA